MKYIVSVSKFVSGSGYQYTEDVDSGTTDETFTAQDWNSSLDEPYEDTDTTWWEIKVRFYADDADTMLDDPISESVTNETVRGQF